jgi:hypothetical protein
VRALVEAFIAAGTPSLPGAPPNPGTSLLVFGVLVFGMFVLIVLGAKWHQHRHRSARDPDPVPGARVIRR